MHAEPQLEPAGIITIDMVLCGKEETASHGTYDGPNWTNYL